MRTVIFVLAAVVPAFAVGQAWAADDLPAFDIAQNCKAKGGVTCTIDETNAKQMLRMNWQKAGLPTVRQREQQEYVELWTCLK